MKVNISRVRRKSVTAIKLAEILFAMHSHAEIENDRNPDEVVYTEDDVLRLLKMLGHPRPDFKGYADKFKPKRK